MSELIFIDTLKVGSSSVISIEAMIGTSEFLATCPPLVEDHEYLSMLQGDFTHTPEEAIDAFDKFLSLHSDPHDGPRIIPVGFGIDRSMLDLYFWFRGLSRSRMWGYFHRPGIDLISFGANVWYRKGLYSIPLPHREFAKRLLVTEGCCGSSDSLNYIPTTRLSQMVYERLCK